MKRQAMAVLVTAAGLALGWAAPSPAGDLGKSVQGKWLLDKVAALEAAAPEAYKSATPAKQKEMRDEMVKTMPDMVVEFTATTATMTAGTDAPQVATYKVTKSEKNTLWMDVTPKGKDAASVEKMTLELVDPDTLNMRKEGEPMALLLHRVKK